MYKDALEKKGLKVKDVHMELSKNLPVCSGLGSSAASVVAAVVALDAIHSEALGQEGCLELMGRLEEKSQALFITIMLLHAISVVCSLSFRKME